MFSASIEDLYEQKRYPRVKNIPSPKPITIIPEEGYLVSFYIVNLSSHLGLTEDLQTLVVESPVTRHILSFWPRVSQKRCEQTCIFITRDTDRDVCIRGPFGTDMESPVSIKVPPA